MKQELLELHRLLDALIQRFENLDKHFKEERDAIRKRDPDRLEHINEIIRLETEEIHAIEHKRVEITTRLAQTLNLNDPTPSLKELDQALGGRAQLADKRDKLRKVMEQAQRANQENQAILKGVTAATEAFLDFVRKGVTTGVGYTRAGTRQTTSDRHIFSKKL